MKTRQSPMGADPGADLPLYQQIKRYILEKIQTGELVPGRRIPSEHELVDTLKVSRMTVNRALRELTENGYLTRQAGVGTFVAEQKPLARLLEVVSIAEEIKRVGGLHTCSVHVLESVPCSRKVASALELDPGEMVFHSVIVHKKNGVPVQLAERWVNPAVAPDYLGQDYTEMTPHEYIQRVAPVQEAQHILEAVLPDHATQKLLEIGPHEPCILLARRTWALNRVATDNQFTYPGSRYRMGSRFKTPVE